MVAPFLLKDGMPVTVIDADDRAFLYGDGFFDTMRLQHGIVALWPFHKARMLRSAKRLGLVFGKAMDARELDLRLEESLHAALQMLAVAETPQALKFQLVRAPAGPGSYGSAQAGVHIYVSCRALTLPSVPVELVVSPLTLPDAPLLAGIKHVNRLNYIVSAHVLEPLNVHQQALFIDAQDRLVETMHHNVFCLHDGRWLTPKLTEQGVHGVVRQWLSELQLADIDIAYENIPLAQMPNVQGIFICNALVGLVAVTSLILPDGTRFVFPVSADVARLQRLLDDFFCGDHPQGFSSN